MPSRRAVLSASAGLALLVVAGVVSHPAPAESPVVPDRTGAPQVADPSAWPAQQVVSLDRLVREFVAAIPRRGSEVFDPPTTAEAESFTQAVAAVRTGRLMVARRLLDHLAYDLVEVEDSGKRRPLFALRERRNGDGTWPHGWGLYVLSARAPGSLVVQVPHPLFDVKTPALGLAAFRRTDGGAFFVAGTHRYANADGASDVAHSEGSMFQHVTRALVEPDSALLQFHGFGEDNLPGYGSVVVSDGQAPPSDTSRAVADALRASGFETCLYDGSACAELGGTTNIQGRWARMIGADFVHVEVARRVRDDERDRRRLAQRTVDAIMRRP